MTVETDHLGKGGEGNGRTPYQRQSCPSSFQGAPQRLDGQGEQNRRRFRVVSAGQLPKGKAISPI